jgi:methionine-rich copper-binding protein CopC
MLYSRFRRRISVFCIFLLLLIGVLSLYPGLIRAHATYERSEPPADAIIPESPLEVHVWFTQELFRREEANALEVFGPDGMQVDKRDARIDDDDRTHMIVSLPTDLPPGKYTVRWRTLSVEDGDSDSGEFSFTIDPAAAAITPQPSPTATPTSTPTPLPPPTPAQTRGGLPCLSGAVFGMLALVIVMPQRRERGGT